MFYLDLHLILIFYIVAKVSHFSMQLQLLYLITVVVFDVCFSLILFSTGFCCFNRCTFFSIKFFSLFFLPFGWSLDDSYFFFVICSVAACEMSFSWLYALSLLSSVTLLFLSLSFFFFLRTWQRLSRVSLTLSHNLFWKKNEKKKLNLSHQWQHS